MKAASGTRTRAKRSLHTFRRAYARADFWDERVKMLTWADRLDAMRRAPEIVRLRA